MKIYKNLQFDKLCDKDIKILTPIMKNAFDQDTRIHLNKESGGPDGYDDGRFLRKFALDKNATAYKILCGNKIIGGIVLWINAKTNENFLGNIFIDIDYENKGIGKTVWEFVENEFPNTKVWRTETPIYSRRNHNFYVNKCGFHIIKIENPKDFQEGSYILEKRMK